MGNDFSEKDWHQRPNTTTPISAAALENMEQRLSEYALGRVTTATFNVADEGAVGDGVTDDTAAFTAAATALGSGNKTLLIPPAHIF